MSSSKLSYLSKYTDDGKKKKKKKEKKKKRKEFDDDDLSMPAMPSPSRDEEDDDEGPTVVMNATQGISSCQNGKEGRRYESDDEPRRRRRNDSDDDEQPRKETCHDSDDEALRRARYDSDDDDEAAHKPRRRHDSDDEDGRNKTRRRYISDNDDGLRKKRRYDAEDDDDDVRSHPKRRHDSDEEQSKPRKRYDSDDDDDEPRSKPRRRYDSDDASPQRTDREKMSSGHSAGLQQAGDFCAAETKIQRRRHEEAQEMVDRHGMGETVYRDEEGRKVDADQVKQKKKLPHLNERESALLNKGRVQKEQEEAYKREWEDVQKSSFARHRDDAGLEDLRRDVIREGDPMATHAAQVRKHRGHPCTAK
jgi:pre-mRNA-splicing factor CWC26